MFQSRDRIFIPSVTAEQMREVDRVATDEFGLGILQMMENAGRNLAENVMDMLGRSRGEVAVLAGSGGNGGGGLCCARHLHNRGLKVRLVLDRVTAALRGVSEIQYRTLYAAGLQPVEAGQVRQVLEQAEIVVDALIGYGLHDQPIGRTAELITLCQYAKRVLSLDMPSGRDATTGDEMGPVVHPERTLTDAEVQQAIESIVDALTRAHNAALRGRSRVLLLQGLSRRGGTAGV